MYRVSEVKVAGDLVRRAGPHGPGAARRHLLQEIHHGDHGAHGAAPRPGWLRLREIDPVPQENPQTKGPDHLPGAAGPPCLRPAHRFRGLNGTTTSSREMRQMEGGYLSNAAVERSKQRLEHSINREGGSRDEPGARHTGPRGRGLRVKEGLPGQFGGGMGYSQSRSIMLNGSIVHGNFLGTGNRVAAKEVQGRCGQVYSISHTDPYSGAAFSARSGSAIAITASTAGSSSAVRHDHRAVRHEDTLAAVGIPVSTRRRCARRSSVHRPGPRSAQQR